MKKIIGALSLLLMPAAFLYGDDSFSDSDTDNGADIAVEYVQIADDTTQALIDAVNNVIDALGVRDWFENIATDDERAELVGYIVELLNITSQAGQQYGRVFQSIQDLTRLNVKEYSATLRFAPTAPIASSEASDMQMADEMASCQLCEAEQA